MKSTESYSTFQLQIEVNSVISKGKKYWKPIGLKEAAKAKALSWLAADFIILKEHPNIKHRVVKTTYFKPLITIV